jgi:hypothetical protein
VLALPQGTSPTPCCCSVCLLLWLLVTLVACSSGCLLPQCSVAGSCYTLRSCNIATAFIYNCYGRVKTVGSSMIGLCHSIGALWKPRLPLPPCECCPKRACMPGILTWAVQQRSCVSSQALHSHHGPRHECVAGAFTPEVLLRLCLVSCRGFS